MFRITKNVLMLTLCLVLFVVPPVALVQSQTSEPVTIDFGLAQFVADQYVHKYYSEFDWRAVDHITLHDINGSIQAYAFVFAVADSDFHSSDDLRRYIQEKSAILTKAKEEQANEEPYTDSAEQARAQVIEARKQQQLNTLEPAERARYEKALHNKARAIADKWRRYQQSWHKVQGEEEVTR